MFERIKRWLAGAPAEPAALANLDAMSVEQLIGLNQQMGRQQDAIREQRKVIARAIDAKLTKGD